MSFISHLTLAGYLKTPLIIEAFGKIKRVDFMPEETKDLHDLDQAFSIGEGQTISQPAVVAFMLELLQPEPGDKILDIGSGSGWTTSLLSYITSRKRKPGKVFALEVIESLKELGEQNTKKYNFVKKGIAQFFLKDGWEGLKSSAPFDKILVSAAAENVPIKLKKQLKKGGKMVIPIKDKKEESFYSQSIWLLQKDKKGKIKISKTPGFVFVPLIKKKKKI